MPGPDHADVQGDGEGRMRERPIVAGNELVARVADALQSHLDVPAFFFGHSMGAVVAFELAELLRQRNQAMPKALFVSGARAPRFRRGWTPPPDPTDEELLRELVPEALQDAELRAVVLPALRADTALYRHYVYAERPLLHCPIHVYGGELDPNVKREHLDAWQEHTACAATII